MRGTSIPEVLGLVGKTPMVRVLESESGKLLVKLEYLNPTGSHKDRVAVYMIRSAVEEGLLKPGGLVVEASSGNTGISVAWVAGLLGYRACIVVEEEASEAKLEVLKALGAEVIRAPLVPLSHPDHPRNVARRIAEERGGVYLNQFENDANWRAHYETTGPEIWEQCGGLIDAFVMGVGTGGTLTGVGRYLKERRDVRVVAVVPKGSPLAGGERGDYIEGLASTTTPSLLDLKVVDEIIEVSLEDALRHMVLLARKHGILAGPSSGANYCASLRVLKEYGGSVVTLAADSIFRYSDLLPKGSI
ncbi:MAG TPA: cysteine synthase family protein [Thermofilaceae archaeon]|nr:cysteine synthase family protein [Thermofilaceae archaeon]